MQLLRRFDARQYVHIPLSGVEVAFVTYLLPLWSCVLSSRQAIFSMPYLVS